MLKYYCIVLKMSIINVKKFPLTQRYDVVMMYWNYIKNDIQKYKIHKNQRQIL